MLHTLLKAFSKLSNLSIRRLKHTRVQVEHYLKSFEEPKCDIDRSYYQYKCQNWDTYNSIQLFLTNIISLFACIPFFIFYLIAGTNTISDSLEYIATGDFILEYIPEEYSKKCIVPSFYKGSLDKKDVVFLYRIVKKHPFSFYFFFKIMCRIANYSYIIRCYSPKIIFCSAEYSFTSSILTNYCELNGVELCNVMHGEKVFDIRDSFFRFDTFYVWDEFYINLFLSLRATATTYLVRPISVPSIRSTGGVNHYTYYLQDQKIEQLIKIKEKFEAIGADYLVRPHPVYSTEDVKKVFNPVNIESNEVSIWDSICKAGNVVSVNSTVNYQAYLAGVPVVLDDISEPEYFDTLKERDYIMFHKNHKIFSQIQPDI